MAAPPKTYVKWLEPPSDIGKVSEISSSWIKDTISGDGRSEPSEVRCRWPGTDRKFRACIISESEFRRVMKQSSASDRKEGRKKQEPQTIMNRIDRGVSTINSTVNCVKSSIDVIGTGVETLLATLTQQHGEQRMASPIINMDPQDDDRNYMNTSFSSAGSPSTFSIRPQHQRPPPTSANRLIPNASSMASSQSNPVSMGSKAVGSVPIPGSSGTETSSRKRPRTTAITVTKPIPEPKVILALNGSDIALGGDNNYTMPLDTYKEALKFSSPDATNLAMVLIRQYLNPDEMNRTCFTEEQLLKKKDGALLDPNLLAAIKKQALEQFPQASIDEESLLRTMKNFFTNMRSGKRRKSRGNPAKASKRGPASATPIKIQVKGGLDALLAKINQLDQSAPIYIFFSGSKNEKGESWCPYCEEAEPYVSEAVEQLKNNAVFIHCDVGTREQWETFDNPFRVHEDFQLTVVPTLLKWKTSERLVEMECAVAVLLEKLMEGDTK